MISNIIENILYFFSELEFEEENHRYTYHNQILPSVSGKIDDFVEKTDWNKIAESIAKRNNRNIEDVFKEWNNKKVFGCERGTDVHEYAEQPVKIEQRRIEDKAVNKFWEELPERYILIAKELRMVHKFLMYCGTTDLVLYDTYTNTIIIVDYKTNEDLFKNFKGKRLKAPFDFLEECPYNKYQIQLSYYQMLIQQIKGLQVSERWIVYFKEDNYSIYKTEDYTPELINVYSCQN